MNDLPKHPGPRLVELLDGTLVFSDREEWRHECEARDIAAWPKHDRDAWLQEIERVRSPEEAARLRKTIDEIIAIAAQKASGR